MRPESRRSQSCPLACWGLLFLVVASATPTHSQEAAPIRPEPVEGAELQALLEAVERNLGGIRSLRTEFEQEKHLSLFSDVVHARGSCIFARPDCLRFEIHQPFQSVLVVRGSSVAKYELVDSIWRKLELGSPDAVLMVTGQISAWIRGRFTEQDELYEIRASRLGGDIRVMLLPRPKELSRHIQSIEVLLAKELTRIRSVTIREPGGDYTELRFVREVRDEELDEAFFDTERDEPFWPHGAGKGSSGPAGAGAGAGAGAAQKPEGPRR